MNEIQDNNFCDNLSKKVLIVERNKKYLELMISLHINIKRLKHMHEKLMIYIAISFTLKI